MRIRQQALGHAHRQERNAALLDQRADRVVGLRIRRALAEDDQRLLRRLQHIERALYGVRRRNLRRCRVDHLDQRLSAGIRAHHLAEQLGGKVEIDAAGTAGHRGTDRARDGDADVLRMQHAVRRFAEWLGDRELIHFLVVALLQIDDLALGRARNQDHRKAIGRGMSERGQAVEEARCGDRETDARLLGQEACDRRGVARILLMTEREHTNAFGLRHAAEIRDRNPRHAIDGVEPVQLERIDDQMEAIRQLLFVCFWLVRCRQHRWLPDLFLWFVCVV